MLDPGSAYILRRVLINTAGSGALCGITDGRAHASGRSPEDSRG
jgi:hypothetical protein